MATREYDPLTLSAAGDALSHVNPICSRGEWIKFARVLYDEYGDDGFGEWDAWSQRHPEYKEKAAKAAWASAKRMASGGGRVAGIASLVYAARAGGWRMRSEHTARRNAEQQRQAEAAREQRRREQREAEAREHAKAAAKAVEAWAAAEQSGLDPAAHGYLMRKGLPALGGVRRAATWVREWITDDGEIRTSSHRDALLVPIWSGPGQLASLQAIFATKAIGYNGSARDKDYLAGGKKHGCYFAIGRLAGALVVLVCEGYATGVSLHLSTGYPVMVCFDASNLAEVAQMVRAKLPAARIVVCADNDQYPNKRGIVHNTGVLSASAAAKECGGVAAVPQFADLSARPTDFDDLRQVAGLDAVREAIEAALNPPADPGPGSGGEPAPDAAAAQDLEPDLPPAPPWDDAAVLETRAPAPGPAPVMEPPPAAKAPAAKPQRQHIEDDDDGPGGNNPYFSILGFNRGVYYVFAHGKRQIMELTKGDISEKGLIELAPLNWWEFHFPGRKSDIGLSQAAEFLIRTAEKKGIYDPNRVRGRGAWVDAGRMVFHHGDYLTVDGRVEDVTKIQSRFVYEADMSLDMDPADSAMASDEGEHLLDLAGRFRWSMPGSAALLAGWVALAPVCGALRWRPHVWLTGGAGCGKSTVLNHYVDHLIGGVALYAQGASSEAGIRQELRSDALPVLFDESESNEERDASRIQNVLSLIRQASTESRARTLKGTAGGQALKFHIRSMFCLASIQVALKQRADVDRLTVLSLRSRGVGQDDGWEQLESDLYDMQRDETLPARLLRRSINLLPVTLQNVRVFTAAAAKRFGSQRDGDQYGTLLAGAWSLISETVASEAEALELIDRYDWSEHREMADVDESQKALAALMEAHIRVGSGVEVTTFELVAVAAGHTVDALVLTAKAADDHLRRHGLAVRDGRLLVSNTSQELKRLVAGSGFEADLRGALLRVPGAKRNEQAKFSGVNARCVSLDLGPVLEGLTPQSSMPI